MPKASHAAITLTPNRRSILTGAGGIAAAGALLALPTATAAAGFSPEFLEYRRRHAAWMACFVKPYEEDDAWEALADERSDAMWEAIRAVISRPARTWQDVIERASVVRNQLFDVVDGEFCQHSMNEELEGAFMKAFFAVAEGGANV